MTTDRKITFFQASGPREGAIVNELYEDDHGALQLRFYCYLGLRGKQPGGPEEQAEQALSNVSRRLIHAQEQERARHVHRADFVEFRGV